MTEKIIELTEIDPLDIFGVQDRLITRLGYYFPGLRIIPRGNAILLKGNKKDIAAFEQSVGKLIEKRRRKRNLDPDDIDSLFERPDTEDVPFQDADEIIVYGNDGKIVRARTKNQKKLVSDYYHHDLLFALGPAGTGKTYTAIALAVRALKSREVKRLILTRPAVEAGERLGFLPGDLKDKLDPYLQPLYDALMDMIPPQKLIIYGGRHHTDRTLSLYAGKDAGKRIRDLGRSAEHQYRTIENVFDQNGKQCQIHRDGRCHPNRPAQ